MIEHTADIGIRATGDSLADLFREATLGMLEITGAGTSRSRGDSVPIAFDDAPDLGALLVDWLSEILYLQDAHDVTIGAVTITSVDTTSVRGRVITYPRERAIEGTPVKAVTFHQLVVEQRDAVWTAQVFFDI